MKKYIERYIHDVVRRLPKDIRQDVEKELYSNIYDMLGDNPTDEEIDQVLHEIGSPRIIANNYKEDKRYVISPLYYDDYIRVLKLVIIIVASIALFFGAIDIIVGMDQPTLIKSIGYIFSRLIGDTVSSLIHAVFILTLIFWIIDRESVKNKKDEWRLKDLPDLPAPNTRRISKSASIVGLVFYTIFSVIFIVILLEYIPIIGWYENKILLAPVLNKTVTDQFLIFFIVSAIIGFIVQVAKIYIGEWKVKLASYYTLSSIISVTIGLLFINHSGLINSQYIAILASKIDISTIKINGAIDTGLKWITFIVILVTIIDLITIWFKTLKQKNKKT